VNFTLYKIIENSNYIEGFIKKFNEPNYSFCIDDIKEINYKEYLDLGAKTGSMIASVKKCDYTKVFPIYSVWRLRENCFLELTHPFERDTFKRIGIRLTKSSKLIEQLPRD